MNRKFTDTWLQNYKPITPRDEIFESGKDGFGVRVTPTSKAFFFKRRVNGKQTRFSLGKYPETSLSEAHVKAAEIKKEINRGADPRETYRLRKPKVADLGAPTFENVVKRFIAEYCKGKEVPLRARTIEGYEWALQGSLTKQWNKLPLSQISRQMVREEIRKLETKTKDSAARFASARLLRAYLSKFFNWAVGEDIAPANPTLGITLRSKAGDSQRERRLLLPELRQVLAAADKLGEPYRDFIWTLVLTGQRRGEVAAMRWSELSLDGTQPTWKIPAENSKNRREHVVPLSPLLVERLRQIKKLGDYVFTTDGTTHISAFSKIKAALDEKLEEPKPEERFKPWRIHDLRHSLATGLADHHGIPPHVIEAVLNHISGAKKGVSGLYNRSPYEAECRRALEGWAQLLCAPSPSANVVPLRV